jgi:hypothetical protein
MTSLLSLCETLRVLRLITSGRGWILQSTYHELIIQMEWKLTHMETKAAD